MYEMSVVEIAMLRTTPKVDDEPEFSSKMAAKEKTVAITPESRLARNGVPRRGWNVPKKGKKLPSAEATASTRSPHIIQAEPEFINVKMNRMQVTPYMKLAAPP